MKFFSFNLVAVMAIINCINAIVPANRNQFEVIINKWHSVMNGKFEEFKNHPLQQTWLDKYLDFVEYEVIHVIERSLKTAELFDEIIPILRQKGNSMNDILNSINEAKSNFNQNLPKLFPKEDLDRLISMNLPTFHGYPPNEAVGLYFEIFFVMNTKPIIPAASANPGALAALLHFTIQQLQRFQKNVNAPNYSIDVLKSDVAFIDRQIEYCKTSFSDLFQLKTTIRNKIETLHPLKAPDLPARSSLPDPNKEDNIVTLFTRKLPETQFGRPTFPSGVLQEFSNAWSLCNKHREKILGLMSKLKNEPQNLERVDPNDPDEILKLERRSYIAGVSIQYFAIQNYLEKIAAVMNIPLNQAYKKLEKEITTKKAGEQKLILDEEKIKQQIKSHLKATALVDMYNDNEYKIVDHLIEMGKVIEAFANGVKDFDQAVEAKQPHYRALGIHLRHLYDGIIQKNLEALLKFVERKVASYEASQASTEKK